MSARDQSPVLTDDFCGVCGADLEPTGGPCAVCFLNQPGEPDEAWRSEEAERRRNEHFYRMGWR